MEANEYVVAATAGGGEELFREIFLVQKHICNSFNSGKVDPDTHNYKL